MPKHPTGDQIKHIARHVPYDMSKSLTLKLQGAQILSTNQIKLISRHFPRDIERLRALIPGLSSDDAATVLKITNTHRRDQEQFAECASVLRSFANGGDYGVHLLNKLHPVVIKHYAMEDEKWEVLTAAGVSVNFETGELMGR